MIVEFDEKIGVRGLEEVHKFMDQFGVKFEKNVSRGAVRAASKPTAQRLKEVAPVGDPSEESKRLYGDYAGALRDSVRTGTTVKNNVATAVIKIGGEFKKGGKKVVIFYAHMIEFTGAIAHLIASRSGKALSIGGKFFRGVEHPGMTAKPFVRKALDATWEQAPQKAGEYIQKRLTAQGIETPDLEIDE